VRTVVVDVRTDCREVESSACLCFRYCLFSVCFGKRMPLTSIGSFCWFFEQKTYFKYFILNFFIQL